MAAGTKKLTVLAALFAAIIAVASANSYKTVVTTVVDDDLNESCMQEIRPEMLRDCMMWMQQRMQGGGGRFRGGEEQMRNQCCNQLNQISSDCVCDALRQMMQEMQQQQKQYGMRMEQMRQMVENLPRTCGLQRPSHCPMRTIFF